jgi:hypothetical protein
MIENVKINRKGMKILVLASSSFNVDEAALGDIAKTMQAFVHKVSSYKGAEVPEDRLVYLLYSSHSFII